MQHDQMNETVIFTVVGETQAGASLFLTVAVIEEMDADPFCSLRSAEIVLPCRSLHSDL